LFDGFPRTIPQAEALEKLLAEFHRKIDVVINLSVSEDEIVRRLSGRLICRECQIPFHREFNPFKECPLGKCHGEFLYQREDDKPETVRERLEVFNRQTAPLIAFFQERGNLITVSGEGKLESINNRIINALQLEN
jgi:adenylate kinase